MKSITVFFWIALVGMSSAVEASLTPTGLRCEYQTNLLGVDVPRPRLSWLLKSEERGQAQTAYRILAASSPEKLSAGRGDLWDSGKVTSDETIHVVYSGKPLTSRMFCWWKIRVWDKDGKPSAWSQPGLWTMGLLTRNDWRGQWIGARGKRHLTDERNRAGGGKSSEAEFKHPAILLRKEAELGKRLIRATAHVCGLGYCELYINGTKAGDHVLDPGFTNYTKRVLYVTYDVTDHFKQGRNAIGVILGNGWYNLPTPDRWGFHAAPWTAPPKLLLNIDLEFADGTKQTIASDDTWKWSTGPIVFNCVRGGETYDARKEKPGWDKPGYNGSDWKPVKIVPAPAGRLVAQQHPPIRVTQSIRPVKLTEPEPGAYVFDLGVNIAGWARLKTSGKPGQKITLQFNELLNEDGTVDMHHCSSLTYGRFQTGEFILKGQGVEVYEPRFTYHGFRYVQVTGLTEKPTLDTLTGRWVHTDVKPAGEFSCSNDKINRILELIVRTQLNNLHGIPTDCPQREKLGWMHDGCVTMEEAIYNFDMATFYTKWFQDMLDAQRPNGYVTSVVPICGWMDGCRDPWWGGAIVIAPWRLYQYYGDKRILKQGYEAMKAYVDHLGTTANNHIVKWNLGDWLEVGKGGPSKRTPIEQVDTCAYFYWANILSQTATVLDKQDDAKKYAALAQAIRASFNKHFLDPATGLYAEDSQTAQALPLYLGMVPDDKRSLVLDQLVNNIKETRHGHLSTGIVGTLYLMYVLTDSGHADLAYTIATQEDFPGWWHMIQSGATSIWEAWGGIGSRNHPTLGSIGAWYFQALAGIRPDPTGPGFKKIVIKPEIVGDLTWVKAHHDTVRGRIRSHWRREKGSFHLTVVIPANTTATVYLPAKQRDSVTEGGRLASQVQGVRFLRMENDRAVFEVASGSYNFCLLTRIRG